MSEGDKANTVERKLPVKEELDEAVPPHELLDVSASRAKGELASRGGLANRHLPSLKKTTSMSSASSQDQSLDDSSLDEELPEAVKPPPPAEATQDGQQDQGSRRELDSDGSQQRSEREASPSKRSPTSLMEDVRQAVLQADVSWWSRIST
ncbi:hypothetical protein OTU49_017466 [Cherax quadricarinatus]|uniref:Uncharacterized protein n=1 Tax=Cherax quadricarinatus TaxID=27406 RepID=A0AAW0Y8F7_CHEQU